MSSILPFERELGGPGEGGAARESVVDALRSRFGMPLPGAQRPDHAQAIAIVRNTLGGPAVDVAWTVGATYSIETAIAEANEQIVA
jgi:hypothetical protein